MKSHTDLEQSKKLKEILAIESADMCFANDGTSIKIDANPYNVRKLMWKDYVVEVIPCWSLAALQDIIKINYRLEKTFFDQSDYSTHFDQSDYCTYSLYDTDEPTFRTVEYDNPVDACYEMIIKLHKRKLL